MTAAKGPIRRTLPHQNPRVHPIPAPVITKQVLQKIPLHPLTGTGVLIEGLVIWNIPRMRAAECNAGK